MAAFALKRASVFFASLLFSVSAYSSYSWDIVLENPITRTPSFVHPAYDNVWKTVFEPYDSGSGWNSTATAKSTANLGLKSDQFAGSAARVATVTAERKIAMSALKTGAVTLVKRVGPLAAPTLMLAGIAMVWDEFKGEWTKPDTDPDHQSYPEGTWCSNFNGQCYDSPSAVCKASPYEGSVAGAMYTDPYVTRVSCVYGPGPDSGINTGIQAKLSYRCPDNTKMSGGVCVPITYVPATAEEIGQAIGESMPGVLQPLLDAIAEHGTSAEKEALRSATDKAPISKSSGSSSTSPSSWSKTQTTSSPAGQKTVTTTQTPNITYVNNTIVNVTTNTHTTTVNEDGTVDEEDTHDEGDESDTEDEDDTDFCAEHPDSAACNPPVDICEKYPDAAACQPPVDICEEHPDASICQPTTDECEEHPERIGCAEFGEADDPELGEDTRDASWSKEASANGQCPDDPEFQFFGQTYKWSMSPICDLASGIRPLVIASSFLGAGVWIFIVARV